MDTKLIIDDKALNSMIDGQMKRLKNMKPVMRVIAQDMQTRKDINFRKQEDPYGKKWAALSDATIAGRRNKSRDTTKILQDTGRLRASFTTKVGDDFAQIGTNVKYAPTHQFGAKKGAYRQNLKGSSLKTGRQWNMPNIPWGDIPARKMIGVNKAMHDKYRRKVWKYISEGLI